MHTGTLWGGPLDGYPVEEADPDQVPRLEIPLTPIKLNTGDGDDPQPIVAVYVWYPETGRYEYAPDMPA